MSATEEVISAELCHSQHNVATKCLAYLWFYRPSLGSLNVHDFSHPLARLPRLEYALELVLYMLSQHHAIGLQTDCMVTVLAPVVEAARLPRVCPMALGYGLPPL